MAELSLVLATIQSADSAEATRALVDAGLRATVLNSVGGFLRMNNVTLLLGAGRSDIPRAISLLSAHCRKRTVFINAHGDIASGYIAPLEAEVGGATIFAVPVERFARFGAKTETIDAPAPAKSEESMKLIIAIVNASHADPILKILTETGYRATLISSAGGFFRKGNATLLIGVEPNRVDDVLRRIESTARQLAPNPDPQAAFATVFVLDAEQHLRV